MMKWLDTYSVKVAAFDDQHKQLFRLIDNLEQAMRSGQAKAKMASTLDELLKYTKTHFSVEEQYLVKISYPDLAAHRLEHQKFVRKIEDSYREFNAGSLNLSIGLMNFLNSWLLDHILKTDQKYSVFMTQTGKVQVPVSV